jgi:hypothetical protein
MPYAEKDFEIRVQGHTLLRVRDGGIKVDGKDFHADLRSLNDLVGILSDVISMAEEAARPRLVESDAALCPTAAEKRDFPYKIVRNA